MRRYVEALMLPPAVALLPPPAVEPVVPVALPVAPAPVPAPVEPPAIEPPDDALVRMNPPPRWLPELLLAPAPVLEDAPPDDELALADWRQPVSVIDWPLWLPDLLLLDPLCPLVPVVPLCPLPDCPLVPVDPLVGGCVVGSWAATPMARAALSMVPKIN